MEGSRMSGERETRLPWERQPGESEQAWEAFQLYRDIGTDRTYMGVAERLHKSGQIMRRWAHRWMWEDRVLAWDNHLDEIARQEIEKGRIAMVKRHIKLAEHLQAVAASQINEWAQKVKEKKPLNLTPADVTRMFDVAMKAERLSRGEPTENTQVTRPGESVDLTPHDLFGSSEYRALREKILEELVAQKALRKGKEQFPAAVSDD